MRGRSRMGVDNTGGGGISHLPGISYLVWHMFLYIRTFLAPSFLFLFVTD